MAYLSMSFLSKELKMQTRLSVVLPDSVRIGDTPLSERKVLYLLHGLSDDDSCWTRFSRIEKYADRRGMVVVMPCALRSMYCDDVLGQNFMKYVACELPDYLNKVFGLSRSKENNFVAGLSMGGLGAMKIALNYPDNYSAVGSFSGVLDLKVLAPFVSEEDRHDFPFMFGKMDEVDTTSLNPTNLLTKRACEKLNIYTACGKQDNLLASTLAFNARMDELGVKYKFALLDGGHEWAFWDRQVDDFLSFINEKQLV